MRSRVNLQTDVVELEITSESDLFFNYIHRVTRDDYDVICRQQRLTTDFATERVCLPYFTSHFVPDHFLPSSFSMAEKESSKCSLQRANEFRIVENITYRYNLLKERLNHFGHHLEVSIDAILFRCVQDVSTYLKTKDPECARQRLFG
ncbi:hypothetical protein, conserved [Babesia ovata]|uniref:Spindle assembly abnormal protein 6 N-terminal domain-containing protein n=1 Tax=Babesia ovata TaxID=189622 RepID=A0A2H6KCB3_9APIC|nr:uncharacterized protein BOVATA_021290 [Babesia ovata]GBE60636.1 hypothetical protein, conserved [Babesia ovata]